MKMAILKETNKPVSGLGGVMGVTSSFGQKLSTVGHYKKDLHIVDVDTSRMDGDGEYLVISKSSYQSLLADNATLSHLKAYGVDNWSGYGEAMSALHSDEDEE